MATREADGTLYTHAGPEIGVASTKAFTCQLVALHLLAMYLGQVRGTLGEDARRKHIADLLRLPSILEQVLKTAKQIEEIAGRFHNRTDFLYLGRGHQLPDRARGRAEAEGDLVHPRRRLSRRRDEARADRAHRRADAGRRDRAGDHVYEKMLGNIQEAKARGGSVIAITTAGDDTIWRLLDGNTDSIISASCHPAGARADRDRHPACSCSRTTSPCGAAATSISRAISRRASR